jgi:YD repeat-containing protein
VSRVLCFPEGCTHAFLAYERSLIAAADGSVTTYILDPAERVVAVSDPDRGFTTYVLDALGQALTVTSADGAVTTMTYDVMGRTLSTSTTGGETTTWEYDTAPNGIGKLASVETLPVGYVQTVEYDTLTRPIRSNTTINGTTVRALTDPLGLPQTIAVLRLLLRPHLLLPSHR